MEEEWRDIEGYEGIYQVSNLGRIKALERVVVVPERILKNVSSGTGYAQINLIRDKKRKICLIHRLVAQAFIPNPDNKSDVNHKKGIKHDNRVSELEWATESENMIHAHRVLGKKSNLKPKKGSSNGNSSLTFTQIEEIKALLAMGTSQRSIAKHYKVTQATICNINRGRTWK